MIASVMVMVDMDCHISAVWGRHVIASVMLKVDMDCHISAGSCRLYIAGVAVEADRVYLNSVVHL